MTKIIPEWFWQMVIGLVIFVSCAAGYYNSDLFNDYISKGYYTVNVDDVFGNSLEILGTITSIVCAAVVAISPPKKIPNFVLLTLPINMWIAISSVWSNTIAASVVYFLKYLIYFTALDISFTNLSRRKIVIAIYLAISAIALASIIVCISDPAFRTSLGSDGWRGLFSQKNRLATFCMFSIFFCTQVKSPNLPLFFVAISTSILLLVMSLGKTEIFLLIYYAITVFIMYTFVNFGITVRRVNSLFSTIFVMIGPVAAGVVFYMVSAGMIDFTGRARLWIWYMHDLGGDLLQGRGGMTSPVDPSFYQRVFSLGIQSAPDSSYVLLMYNLGLIGLAIYFANIAMIWRRALTIGNKNSIKFIVMLSCYLIYASMESSARLVLEYSTFVVLVVLHFLDQTETQPAATRWVRPRRFVRVV